MSETNKISILLEVVDKGSAELKKFSKGLDDIKGKLASLAAVGGFTLLVKSAIDAADEIGKAAQKIGISVESLSALSYAAKLADVSFEGLVGGMKKLSVAMTDALDPNSEMANAFKALGIKVTDTEGKMKTADAVFAEIATRFKEAPDGVSKTAIAMQIFGKAGAELIPLLNSGAEGLAEMRAEAEKLGVIYDKETTKSAEEFNDSLTRMGVAAGGLGLQIAKEILPTLNQLATSFVEARKNGGDFALFTEGVGIIFREVVKTASTVVGAIVAIGKGIGALAAAAMSVANGDFGGATDILKSWKEDTDKASIANEKFKKSIDDAAIASKNEKKATDDNGEAKKRDIDYRKKQTDETAKLNRQFDKIVEGLLKEKAGLENLTKVQEIERQIREGSYSKFTQQQQSRLLLIAAEIDATKELKKVIDSMSSGYGAAMSDVIGAFSTIDGLSDKNFTAVISLNALKKAGEGAAEAIAAVNSDSAIMGMSAKVDRGLNYARKFAESYATALNGDIELSDAQRKAMEKQLVALQQQIVAYETQKEVIDGMAAVSGNYHQALVNSVEQQRSLNIETEQWREYIGGARDQTEKLALAEENAFKWLSEGVISAKEFEAIMQKIDVSKIENAKKGMTDFDKKMVDVAKSFQDYIGNSFYDAMQGQFDWTFAGFKKLIDKMVAEALARKLATALFGDITKTGQVDSGSAGAGLLAGFIKMFGFRETGGDVQAGKPYIVGEKRAELFIPQTNGTILPSLDAAKGMSGGSNNLTVHIQAMDSQDVLRAMDSIKRPLAEMLNGTNRSYNLGAR